MAGPTDAELEDETAAPEDARETPADTGEPNGDDAHVRRRREDSLRRFELGVLREQLLDPDAVEADGDLEVVVLFLDRDHIADPELGMAHAHAGSRPAAGLVLGLVAVGRLPPRTLPRGPCRRTGWS